MNKVPKERIEEIILDALRIERDHHGIITRELDWYECQANDTIFRVCNRSFTC